MFALKNVAFFGHMDGWEYQDRVMALCSFMCDALCSVFPKTSNQAWGWAVPFWRIFNWKVKISTRPRDKSCCHSSQPPPRPPLCVSLSTYTYVGVLHPAHSSVISILRPRAFKCLSGSSQTEHSSASWISLRLVWGGCFVVWELLALTCWWGCWLCTIAVHCQLPGICVSQLTTCR